MRTAITVIITTALLGLMANPVWSTSIPSGCSEKFTVNGIKTKYANLLSHKALAKNDKTNGLWASWDYSSANAVKKAVLKNCKNQYESTCRLIDVDGKQCKGSSGDSTTGTFKVTSPNGGQEFQTRKKYLLKWNQGKGGTYVKIQLLKSDKAYKTIKAKTKNDGKFGRFHPP